MGAALGIAFGLAAFRYLGFGYFVPPLIVVGPTAFCLGVAFPVVVRCYTDNARAIGRRVGELYAWNTIGCIFGALAGGFLLIPVFGAGKSGAILGGITAIASVALFAVHPKGFRRVRLADVAGLIVAAVILATNGDPYRDVIFSRYSPGGKYSGTSSRRPRLRRPPAFPIFP